MSTLPEENLTALLVSKLKRNTVPHLPLTEVRAITSLRGTALAALGRSPSPFEFSMVSERGHQKTYLRLRLREETILQLLPISLNDLSTAYRDAADEVTRIIEALSARGAVYLQDGHLITSPASVSIQTDLAQPEPLDETVDLRVLNHLEDIEQDRINFGLYETFVSQSEILRRSQEHDRDEALGQKQVEDGLRRLVDNHYVLKLGDKYRSRISEIVRLLKNVKQRFPNTPIEQAPYLIQSLQVRFRQRQQLIRQRTFQDTLSTIHNRHPTRPLLSQALQAVKSGFSRAIGRSPKETELTNVQQRSLREITSAYLQRKGEGFVITGNTGSGKTEAALLPLLIGAAEECVEGVKGCKILLIYPRQALAKNQLERIVQYTAAINEELCQTGHANRALSVGIAFGETPVREREIREGGRRGKEIVRGKWTYQKGNGYALPYFRDRNDDPVFVRERTKAGSDWVLEPTSGTWKFRHFRATRQEIQDDPPDILIITTEMLHRWLGDPDFTPFFGGPKNTGDAPFCAPRAVVVDEIHLYDTIHGSQVGMLLRRLRHRLSQAMKKYESGTWRNPLLIGMSATIGQPTQFWQELSGAQLVTAISPNEEDFENAKGREYFLFLRPETFSRGKYVGDASTAIQTVMTIAHNMVRRRPNKEHSGKHRSLVFQDSIGKVKRLAFEFHDAESNKELALLRIPKSEDAPSLESALFHEGEYWYFEARDPDQYSERRRIRGAPATPLTSASTPVYSGTSKAAADLLQKDIIFATTSLEVGYDDSSIQFVMQHHAPRNAASFVQKKGRGGRSQSDRPITAVTLSQRSFKDAFYYQNPQLLYDPADYVPPLNVANDFVQHFQTIALIFDTLAFHPNLSPFPSTSLEVQLNIVDEALDNPLLAGALDQAFKEVATRSFQRTGWRQVWQDFKASLRKADRTYHPSKVTTQDLFLLCPDLPRNLFSTINLPVVQVMSRRASKINGNDWHIAEEDIALAFAELAPGRVTRRYGRKVGSKHHLHWRALTAKVDQGGTSQQSRHDQVAVERYKANRTDNEGNPNPGPFNPALLKDVSRPGMWGAAWRDLLPRRVHDLYGDDLPHRFYRTRYVELWDFGTVDERNPQRPNSNWYGEFLQDGSIKLRFDEGKTYRTSLKARLVDPNSNAYSLSFSVTKPLDGSVPKERLALPPIFRGLVDDIEFYYGEVASQPSRLQAWEVHYGAEAHIRLLSNGPNDPNAGMGHNLVKYISEHDGKPTFFGYDLDTEGLRVPYDAERLSWVAEKILDEIWENPRQRTHLQDQYLRYLLKTETWPQRNAQHPITVYDQRLLADVIATMRAEARHHDMPDVDAFLTCLTDRDGLTQLLDLAKRYWCDERVFTDDFLTRVRSTLTTREVYEFLRERIFPRLTNRASVIRFLEDTLVHSLKHATRNLFLTEGSTRDEEVGSHAVLDIAYGHAPAEHAFYVYERNRGGNGSSRVAAAVLRKGQSGSEEDRIGHRIRRWWDVSLACPVGDEEEFLKAVMRRVGEQLLALQEAFFATPAADRTDVGADLVRLLRQEIGPHSIFQTREAKLRQLGGLLTSELRMGKRTVRRFPLQLELLQLEDALAERFQRPPTQTELAGYAFQQLITAQDQYPHLAELKQMYEEHAEVLEQTSASTDEEDPAGWQDRFLAQVEHLTLSSCSDACPACLASRCDLGRIEVTRHTLSRRYLRMAHKHLTANLTFEEESRSPENLRNHAQANGGVVILRRSGEANPHTLRSLKNEGFVTVSSIFDYSTLVTHTILQLDSA